MFDGGKDNFAWHADAFRPRRRTITACRGYPYLVAPNPAELPFATQPGGFNGRQPNSGRATRAASVGGSYLFTGGFAGIALIAEQQPLWHSRARRRRPPHPHRRAPDQGDRQGRVPRRRRRSTWCAAGGATPTTSTTSSALPTRPIRPATACARPSPTRSWRAASRGQLAPVDLRFAQITTTIGVRGQPAAVHRARRRSGKPAQRAVRPEPQRPAGGLRVQRVQVRRRDARRRSPAASSTSACSGSAPAFVPDTFADPERDRSRDGARSYIHAEERQRRPDPESARGTSSAASRRNTSSARRSPPSCSRAGRMTPPPPSTSATPISRSRPPSRSRRDCAKRRARSASKPPPMPRASTASSSAVSPATPATKRARAWPVRGLELRPGALLAARRDLPRRRIPVPVGPASDVARLLGRGRPIRHRARHLHRRHQRAAHPAAALGGGVYFRSAEWFARISLLHAFAQNDIALHRRDADRELQPAEGRAQPHRRFNGRSLGRQARSPSASSATICSTRTSATTSPTPRTWC